MTVLQERVSLIHRMGCRKLSYYQEGGTGKIVPLFLGEGYVKKTQPEKKRDDYYPFGLTFNSFTRSYSEPQKYKYNGKEIQEETGWYDYGLRNYDAAIGRWFNEDPLASEYYSYSPYNYTLNNPIRFIDPDGSFVDDYRIFGDGSIVRLETDDATDSFTYVEDDGTEHDIGTYEKNESGLIQLGNVDYNSGDVSVDITAKPGNSSELFVSGKAMASLIGASIDSGEEIYVTRASNSDGSSPGDSESHVNGKNLDVRFAGQNGSRSSINYSPNAGGLDSFNQIDQAASANMNAGLKKYGWKGIKASTLGVTNTTMVDGKPVSTTTNYNVSGTSNLADHYDHQHLQGYNPRYDSRKSAPPMVQPIRTIPF